jgi:hypothetical protein
MRLMDMGFVVIRLFARFLSIGSHLCPALLSANAAQRSQDNRGKRARRE